MRLRLLGRAQDEGVVEEGAAVEEDGFGLEEEFGEEGEVLGVELRGGVLARIGGGGRRGMAYFVVFTVNLVDGVGVFFVDYFSRRRLILQGTDFLHTSVRCLQDNFTAVSSKALDTYTMPTNP